MMTNNSNVFGPLVSVILPVYNEELFIRETLESIVCQDYKNLEILISNNYSSDGTADLCREFANRDQRIKFFEQTSNIGAIANHAFLTSKAKGKYIILTSGHDKWSENYILANVKSLEDNRSALLSYGTPCWIDEKGLPFDRFSGWFDTRGLSAISRFFFVFWGKPNPILGLIRRDKFPDLTNFNFVGADNVILCRLALQGEFIHTVNTIFCRRQNRQSESHKQRLKRYVSDEMKIRNSLFTSLFPLIKMPVELFKTVMLSPVSLTEKLAILFVLLVAMPIKYFSEKQVDCYVNP